MKLFNVGKALPIRNKLRSLLGMKPAPETLHITKVNSEIDELLPKLPAAQRSSIEKDIEAAQPKRKTLLARNGTYTEFRTSKGNEFMQSNNDTITKLAATTAAQTTEVQKLNEKISELSTQVAALPKAPEPPKTFGELCRHLHKSGTSKTHSIQEAIKQNPAFYQAWKAHGCKEPLWNN